MLSSATQVSGVPPCPQHWAWGQLQFLLVTWFPSLAGPGEEQGPESTLLQAQGQPERSRQAHGSDRSWSCSHAAPLGPDLGVQLRLVSAGAQVLARRLLSGRAGWGRWGRC